MADIQEYKCPCCGGAIAFDSTLQKMKCPFCGTEFDMETLKEYDKDLENVSKQDEMKWEEPGNVWHEGETEGMRVYVCKSCGGQIIGDDTLASTACPFCGNPVVMMGQFQGDLKPDYVIPFKLDKEAAKAGYRNHLKGKKLLPKVFESENHIDEIKGIYVPFWLYDADTQGAATYIGTQTRIWTDRKYQYTETSYYSVYREGQVQFYKVPVDGSTSMPNDLMESIEPYDFSEAVDFQTAYLAGYLANRYDISAEESKEHANQRIKHSMEDALASTVHGYMTVNVKDSVVNVSNGDAKYALYPVWILNTTWQGQPYLFAMNGQTGKVVGDLPADKGKLVKYRILITVIIAVIIFLIAYFIF